jgi:hypothetical protein
MVFASEQSIRQDANGFADAVTMGMEVGTAQQGSLCRFAVGSYTTLAVVERLGR